MLKRLSSVRLTAVALALATMSTAAIAQSQEDQQACMNDAFRVCSATIPDRARTTACTWSRSLAARSNSRFSEAFCI